MANELSLPQGFGAVSSVFGGASKTNDELGAGVASSYGVVGYKGKVWSIRYQGNEEIVMREDGDGPKNSIEVVVVKASPAISKIFYKGGYVEGSNAAPDCWSADGVKPDGGVQNKVASTCAACPMNAWGSRVTDAGKQGKACADSRRVAVVPVADMDNELFGGPLLLRIPAASLKDLKAYGDLLNSYQYPYYACATRIAFDPKEAYPKFVFSAIRPLSDAEAQKVMSLRDDKRVSAVLSETAEARAQGVQQEEAKAVPASPFEQMTPAPVAQVSAPAVGTTAPTPAASAPTATVTTATPATDPAAEQALAAKKAAIAEKKRKAAEAAAEAARLAALAAADLDDEDDTLEDGEEEIAYMSPSLVTPTGNGAGNGAAPASFDDMLENIL